MDLHRHLISFASQLVGLCVWLALLWIVFAPLERIFGNRSQKMFRRYFGADLCYYFLNGIIPKLLLTLALTALAAGLHRLVPVAFYSSVAEMPLWLRLAAGLVVNEIGGYWGHRWSHQIPFLWRFHAIHHSAEEMDWLVAVKAHPIDIFFTRLCAMVPLYVLGLAQPLGNKFDFVPFAVTLVGMYWAYFIHANVHWRFGWLEWLVSTPAFHHWHHTNDAPEVINKNYAAMLPWVDKCFGTHYLPRAWPSKYGTNTPVALGLAGQLLNPPAQLGNGTRDNIVLTKISLPMVSSAAARLGMQPGSERP
jgi:sterol desaturase/sphingolipid hydroxylase (fatty acid hydroxylase superfamily)